MRTVNQIMIEGEDVEIGSDSDVSDTSQISRIAYKVYALHQSGFEVHVTQVTKWIYYACHIR